MGKGVGLNSANAQYLMRHWDRGDWDRSGVAEIRMGRDSL